MRKKLSILALALPVILALGSCVLHEEPKRTANGELGVDPTQVVLDAELTLNVELPGTDQTIFELPDTVMHRFIIEAYNRDREVVDRQVIYNEDLAATTFVLPVTMRLHASNYRIVVWSDYVRVSDPEAQLYYNAESLVPIVNNGSYRANTNAKDAFSGCADIELLQYADQWNAKVTADIPLLRPMGRYELVSTDVEAFRRRLAEGNISGTHFSANIKYSGYLTVGYNCYDQIRKHSLNYMSYKTSFRVPVSDTSMSLGFDYLFVSPDENIEVAVEIEIVNENNETVSRSFVSLPVTRNMNTVVKGRFLTSTADGGLNIDPGYDGDVTVDVGTLTPER